MLLDKFVRYFRGWILFVINIIMGILTTNRFKILIYILVLTRFNNLTYSVSKRSNQFGKKPPGIIGRRFFFIRNPNIMGLNNGFYYNNRNLLENPYDSNSNLESLNHYSQLKAKNRFSDNNGGFVDYYKILSLDKSCSSKDVENKYKKINDTLSSLPGVDPKLRNDVDTAYNILSNEKMRSEYDKLYDNLKNNEDYYLIDNKSNPMSDSYDDASEELEFSIINDDNDSPDMDFGGSLFGNFFNNLFGFNKNKKERMVPINKTRTLSANNVTYNADIDLKTLLLGGNVPITVRKWEDCNFCNFNDSATQSYLDKCKTCNGKGMETKEKRSQFGFVRSSRTCMKCQGTGYRRLKDCSKCENTGRILKDTTVKVNVPFNAKVGSVIKLKGMGHSGGFHMKDGDLYVKLNLKENKNEYMDGGRIITVYNLPYTKAILGEKATVTTFIGDKEVVIPQYSQQGDEIKVGTYKNMEHYVKLNVQLPKNLSKEELEQLRKIDKN